MAFCTQTKRMGLEMCGTADPEGIKRGISISGDRFEDWTPHWPNLLQWMKRV